VRIQGEWNSWLRYFVNGVHVTAADAVARAARPIPGNARFSWSGSRENASCRRSSVGLRK
jgi:hypothetical protein